MDPNAALVELDQAMKLGDKLDVISYSEALGRWLTHGGFMPSFKSGDWRADLTREQLRRHFQALNRAASIEGE